MGKLYHQDFYGWTQDQADALRRRSTNEIDWDNLLAEIEGLGKLCSKRTAQPFGGPAGAPFKMAAAADKADSFLGLDGARATLASLYSPRGKP